MLDGSEYIECSCGSPQDTIRFTLDIEGGLIYIDIYNADKSLWRRIRDAIKKRYWDHTMIDLGEAIKLKEFLDKFIEGKKNHKCLCCGRNEN